MRALETIAEAGAAAVARDDADGRVEAMREYGRGLTALSDASGVDIACREHRAIGAIAAECGVAYKSCGAGGGDVGVALGTDSLALDEFKKRAGRAGWQLLNLATDTEGLETRVRSGGFL
jgi:phosphomevalonate kinase